MALKLKSILKLIHPKIGKVLGKLVGLDVHKASAIAFALKAVDYSCFRLILSEARSDEANGRLRVRCRRGSGLTAPLGEEAA